MYMPIVLRNGAEDNSIRDSGFVHGVHLKKN